MKDLTNSNIDRQNILNNRFALEKIQELKHNGYILSKGKQLKEFKLQFAHVINVPSKTTPRQAQRVV